MPEVLSEITNEKGTMLLSDVLRGADALDALNQEDGGGSNNEFTSFKSGSEYTVKVLGPADIMAFDSYGIFGKMHSFVAEKPSKKNKNGFPIDELTPWDKAYRYHKDKSEDFSDEHGQEASKYRVKRRFAMGFYDLDSGEQIIIDVSKAQGQAIYSTIKKYEKRLGKLAFELSKTGSGTSTTVSLSPVIDMEEDLTDKQRENFEKAPEEFDKTKFDGILFERDEKAQIEALHEVGFDVTKIGFEVPKADDDNADEAAPIGSGEDGEITDDDLPF